MVEKINIYCKLERFKASVLLLVLLSLASPLLSPPLIPFCLLPPKQVALDRLELEGVPDRMTCDHDETFSFTYLNPLLVKSVFTLSWRSKLALTSNYLSMSLLEDRDITRPPIFPKH